MAVDQQIDGSQTSSMSRRDREQGEREGSGSGRGGTCRRRSSAARLGVDGGGLGQQLGGGGVACAELQRRHGAVAVRLGGELRLLLCCPAASR